MSIPTVPVVSYRVYDWESLVVEQWGPEWAMNDIAYEMRNGRKFESTDRYKTGIYGITAVSSGGMFGLLYDPVVPNPYPDMYFPHHILQDPSGGLIGDG